MRAPTPVFVAAAFVVIYAYEGSTVSLPALSPCKYGFLCGMRMVFGSLIVE